MCASKTWQQLSLLDMQTLPAIGGKYDCID
jgi:hypothetical protein